MNRIGQLLSLITLLISTHTYAQLDTISSGEDKRKFTFMFEGGLMLYKSGTLEHHNDFSINQVSLYRLGRLAQIGLGIGYEGFANFQSLPLFVQWQGELLKQKSGPYYYFRGGYTRMFDRNDNFNEIKDGKFFSLGGGYAWQLEKIKLYFALGYKKMNLETEDVPVYYYFNYTDPSIQTTHWKLQRIELKMGVSF